MDNRRVEKKTRYRDATVANTVTIVPKELQWLGFCQNDFHTDKKTIFPPLILPTIVKASCGRTAKYALNSCHQTSMTLVEHVFLPPLAKHKTGQYSGCLNAAKQGGTVKRATNAEH